MKVEPDNDADRRLLIEAFDHEPDSYEALIKDHIVRYVRQTFPGMKVTKADHEKYPTLLKVYLEQQPSN